MNTKVSVVIPVYNTSNYLRECLDSVINQTLRDIEIICINDGSTDNCLEILKMYAAQDNRIKIIDKQNEGAGAARNDGVKFISGEYLLFLDSDDFLELNALEVLYNQIINDKSDIIFYNINCVIDNSRISFIDAVGVYKTRFHSSSFETKEAYDILYDANALPFKMYKTNIWTNNNIQYTNHAFGEDSLPFFEFLAQCNRISICDKPLLYYRKHQNSATANMQNNIDDLFDIFYLCEKSILCKKNGEKIISSYLNNRIRSFVYWMSAIDLKNRKKYYNRVKEIFLYIKKRYGYETIKKSEFLSEFKKIISMSYYKYRFLCVTKTFFIVFKSHVI